MHRVILGIRVDNYKTLKEALNKIYAKNSKGKIAVVSITHVSIVNYINNISVMKIIFFLKIY